MFSFGKIFRYKDAYYIYLVQVSDVTYAAKILDLEITKQLLRKLDGLPKTRNDQTDNSPLFSFVILTTDDFCNQAAHYGGQGMLGELPCEIVGEINEDDRNTLIDVIVADTASPIALRNAIGEMFPE